MPQLNASYIDKVMESLDRYRFSVDDFEVSFPEHGEFVVIKFIPYKSFVFSVSETTHTENISSNRTFSLDSTTRSKDIKKLITSESPGVHKETDEIIIGSLNKVPDRLYSWCENIDRELSFLANQTPDETLKEELESIFTVEISDPE